MRLNLVQDRWSTAKRILQRHGALVRLAGCFVFVFVATLSISMQRVGNLVWVGNGLLLSYLLLAPRHRWPHYLAVGTAAMVTGALLGNSHEWREAIVLTTLNIIEISIAAFALRRRSTALPRFTDHRYLLRFMFYAVVLAPSLTGIAYGFLFATWKSTSVLQGFITWVSTDSLGTAIMAPGCVALFQAPLKLPARWQSLLLYMAALVAITVAAFAQSHLPIILLIYPTVALILFRFGLAWASASTIFIAAVGGWFTLHGIGPFSLLSPGSRVGGTVMFQLYIAAGMFMAFAASTVTDELRSTEQKLRKIVYLHDLVTENSRDVIILADFDGRRSYVSAAASNWGDWKREELLNMNSMAIVHPEDRPKALGIVENLRRGGDGALFECRVRKKTGDYVWVEANLRPVRDHASGKAIGILNMIRDISERKQAEHDLKRAYAVLEALAVTDPLTRLANRRRFDQCLSAEWRRSMREHLPISLLLIDVDWFKSYNDTYGHPSGDDCLRQIAATALEVVTRPGDLVARIGGEEFAVILPNTPNAGAVQVANLIGEALHLRNLPHSYNPAGQVTISVGCATVIPSPGQHVVMLMQAADDALYVAKNAGRNQICNAEEKLPAEPSVQAS